MNVCIFCHSSLLRHIRQGDIHWFCPQCRQDMPSVELDATDPVVTDQEKDFLQPVEAVDLEASAPLPYVLT